MIQRVDLKDSNLQSFLINNNITNIIESPFNVNIVYIENKEIIAMANYSIMYERAEINYIFTKVDFRNRGIGLELVKYIIEQCKFCENITLEVCKTNNYAISLYKKVGFEEVGIRKSYYNGIDGILMYKKILKTH